MRKCHDAERCRTPERREKASTAPSNVGISKRPREGGHGGGGGGGVGEAGRGILGVGVGAFCPRT